MGEQSESLIGALNGIRDVLEARSGIRSIEYPLIAFPFEKVLAFNNNEFSFLRGVKDGQPYFTSNGEITDLWHNLLPGSKVQSTFPVTLDKFLDTLRWPNEQPEPFDIPTNHSVDTTNAEPAASSKQAYFFGDGSYLVTVGPSIPKIVPTKDGGAQFWVSSVGVISQGQGRYEGARGMSVYTGSAYLKDFPISSPEGQVAYLEKGFSILVGTYFKLVLKGDQGKAPSLPPPPVPGGQRGPRKAGSSPAKRVSRSAR